MEMVLEYFYNNQWIRQNNYDSFNDYAHWISCKMSFFKSFKGGITVGIGLIGIDLVMGLVYTYISPVANLLVSQFGLNFVKY